MRQFLLLLTVCLLTVISASAEEKAKFLDQNKVWEYGFQVEHTVIEYHCSGSLYRYEIEGSEEHNGKTYDVLWQTQAISWKMIDSDNENDYFAVDTITTKHKVCLLREEDDKIYMPYFPDQPEIYYLRLNYAATPENGIWHVIPQPDNYATIQTINFKDNDEILLFDFKAEAGDKINLWGISNCMFSNEEYVEENTPCLFEYTVNEVNTHLTEEGDIEKTITSGFKFWPEYNQSTNTFKYNTIAGAIGGDSFILGPMVRINVKTNGVHESFWFNNLYDKKGNVIFKGGNFKVPANQASVSKIEKDGKAAGLKYDVMGREIKNPEPGSIYIQDGRKYIAR